jgi:hypothetical protein
VAETLKRVRIDKGNNIEIVYRVDEHNVIIPPETWISQRFI